MASGTANVHAQPQAEPQLKPVEATDSVTHLVFGPVMNVTFRRARWHQSISRSRTQSLGRRQGAGGFTGWRSATVEVSRSRIDGASRAAPECHVDHRPETRCVTLSLLQLVSDAASGLRLRIGRAVPPRPFFDGLWAATISIKR